MLTFITMCLAITLDVLIRVSVVLTASILLAYTARRNAALRHAILAAGLAAAFRSVKFERLESPDGERPRRCLWSARIF